MSAAMPPPLRPMGEAVTFRPFEITITSAHAERRPGSAVLTVDYAVKNMSDKAATAPALSIGSPDGRLYSSTNTDVAVPPGSDVRLTTRFSLPTQFDEGEWLAVVGRPDGPRIRLR